MGTIADKLTYLEGTKTAIKDAIVAKGVAVSGTDTFRSYATKIGEIPSGEVVDKKKYGISIDNMFGNVDENGMYVRPTEPFTPDFSSIKDLSSDALYYKFYNNSSVVGDVVFGFERISGNDAMRCAFLNCSNLASALFPQLTTISGTGAMQGAFQSCTKLTSVSFPALTEVANYSMRSAFQSCAKLTSVSFPALTTVGASAMPVMFSNCDSLTSISFPALTTIGNSGFGSSTYNYIFYNCSAMTEIHFRADAQATIEAVTGYADKWGAANATIYFDL